MTSCESLCIRTYSTFQIIMFNSLAKDLLQCNKTLKGRKLEDWIVRDSLTGALPEEEKHAFTKGSKMAHGRVVSKYYTS